MIGLRPLTQAIRGAFTRSTEIRTPQVRFVMNSRFLLVLAILPALPVETASASPRRPNVVVVITDDQGYGDLSCHGNPVLKTPNLDRLHGESVRLTDFHVAPMCTPTRGQLMTGRDCLRNGAMNVSSGRTLLRPEFPTMAEIFASGGYCCGQFGKWHLGDNYPYRPHDRGFHDAVWYPSSHIGSAPDFWNNDYFDDVYYRNDRREKFTGYTTDVFFDEAIKWMRAQAAERKPFFCYLATAAAHGPLFVPERYRKPYQDQPPNVASFFGMVADIDENMGRLESMLRETGLRDDTIVVFLTDNGGTAGVPVFNAGMRGRKVELWDGGHRVPCFIRRTGGELGEPRDISELTHVQDLLPTLIELCRVKKPAEAEFDGMSLAPLLRGDASRLPDRMLVAQFSRMQAPTPQKGDAAVLWRRWRLVGGDALFDLQTDPAQSNNVIERHPDVAARMRAHYDRWWEGVEPRVNEFGAVVIGADRETPCLLSPCEWQDVFLDQGAQVRRGVRTNGVWNVEVDRDGEYAFELRRWPSEADAPLAAELPAAKFADGVSGPGVSLPIAKARLRIAEFDESRPTATGDTAATFVAKLKAGRTRLQTWFFDAEGAELCGAYYVYVRRR